MSELIKRLNATCECHYPCFECRLLMQEAAEEIERLRAELDNREEEVRIRDTDHKLLAYVRSIPCSCHYPDPVEQFGCGEEHFPPLMKCPRCAALHSSAAGATSNG